MLIRDNAIDIAAQNGAVLNARALDKEHFRKELFATLREKIDALEIATTLSNTDREKKIRNELVTIFELADAFMSNEGLAPDSVYHEQRKQRDEVGTPDCLGLGGFRKRLFLIEGKV